jgi:hypothetical protein
MSIAQQLMPGPNPYAPYMGVPFGGGGAAQAQGGFYFGKPSGYVPTPYWNRPRLDAYGYPYRGQSAFSNFSLFPKEAAQPIYRDPRTVAAAAPAYNTAVETRVPEWRPTSIYDTYGYRFMAVSNLLFGGAIGGVTVGVLTYVFIDDVRDWLKDAEGSFVAVGALVGAALGVSFILRNPIVTEMYSAFTAK